ncbi:methyltransferase [Streptacidiphilus sp. EB103A]|uniref:methyltransferase n=1 Tax=Streptacidiphilus sp. EB103A TaxID=3156275 RepID=UPI00351832CF
MSAGNRETPDLMALYHASGPWISQTLFVAAQLGLADLLSDKPRRVSEIAQATDSNEDALYRFCRALTVFGMLTEHPQRSFALTPSGAVLARDAPNGFRDGVLLQSGAVFRAWGDVLHTVRTGLPAFDKTFGMDYFEFLASHPEEAALFNRAMGATMAGAVAAIQRYEFAGCNTVVDVGGGDGRLIASVLARHPQMKGILQDLPETVEQAHQQLVPAGVADRCALLGQDFFEAVAPGGDAYLLSRVLHDWNDDKALQILRQVRTSMPPHARLVIVDSVLRPTDDEQLSVLGDLLMLVILGGKERSEADWTALLDSAGFDIRHITDDPGTETTRGHSIIEAVPQPR